MELTSEVSQSSFHLSGFTGTKARDHGDHLRGLDKLLFNHLAKRWSQPRN
jgi:hypothetical protein